jgi:hypothetical protein
MRRRAAAILRALTTPTRPRKNEPKPESAEGRHSGNGGEK